MKEVAIYGRVSTIHQTADNQLLLLKQIARQNNWHVVDNYIDTGISGSKGREKRLEFDRLCRDMSSKKFEQILVWDISRLSRSLQHLVEFLGEANSIGCNLYIHQSGLDTSTPSGRMMFQMVGVFSEFERSMISERVKLGLQRVKLSGKKLGRPITITNKTKERVIELLALDYKYGAISEELNISKMTVSRIKRSI